MIEKLSELSGLKLYESDDLFESMQSHQDAVFFSGALRTAAQDLIRIANDIRLLSSGPTTGLGGDHLPAGAARLVDYARQGQPGDGGNARHGDVPRHAATISR